jgi:hypothetical protein
MWVQTLDATAKSLQATIQYQDARLAEYSGRQPQGSDAGTARMTVKSMNPRFGEDPIKLDVFITNSGNAAAKGFRYSMNGGIADHLFTAAELDADFISVKSTMKDLEARQVDSELQPGEDSTLTQIYNGTPL